MYCKKNSLSSMCQIQTHTICVIYIHVHMRVCTKCVRIMLEKIKRREHETKVIAYTYSIYICNYKLYKLSLVYNVLYEIEFFLFLMRAFHGLMIFLSTALLRGLFNKVLKIIILLILSYVTALENFLG